MFISSAIVIIVGLIYGFYPSRILPIVFGFEVRNIELQNIFRAIGGMYLIFGFFWLYGLKKCGYLKQIILTNVLFMGGLGFGRMVSLMFDGFSSQFLIGLILEVLFLVWGLVNLKQIDEEFIHNSRM